ncbi:MAG: hypothetical protein Q7R71_01460, partial [bacterium]|nr:hypothetical protein [bacterium]
IIDINNIASRRSLSLKDVQLGAVSDSRSARNDLSGGPSGDAVSSATIGFSVNASYDNMLAFLADLEHSLRIIDVQSLSFTAGASNAADYAFSIRTYWLH